MDKRIFHILNYIETHLGDPLNLEHLADQVHLSPSQFHRLFKKETGRSPFSFVEELRQEGALNLIKNSDLDIMDISERLGYKNYETFSRAFKKKNYICPDDYRGIIQAINKSGIGPDHEQIIVTADHHTSEEGLINLIKEIIEQNNISEDALASAKVFKILPKTEGSDQGKVLVRNKYEMSEDSYLWRQILDR